MSWGFFAWPELGYVEIGGDDAFHLHQFELVEIVLGNSNIVLVDFAVGCALPTCQPHVLLAVVGAVYDDLRRCLAVDGLVQLVLYGGKEAFSGGGGPVVVQRGGICR